MDTITYQKARADVEQAKSDLHWHLSKAASYVLMGCELGDPYYEAINAAKEAEGRWRAAHGAYMRSFLDSAGPDHGR